MATKATIKTYFQTGDVPTQSEYETTIDEMVTISNAETISATKTFTAKQRFTASESLSIKHLLLVESTGASNEAYGELTLVGGTKTITNDKASGNDVWYCRKTAGGTLGHLSVSISGSGFTITSTSGTETSTILWWIIKRDTP